MKESYSTQHIQDLLCLEQMRHGGFPELCRGAESSMCLRNSTQDFDPPHDVQPVKALQVLRG